MTNTAASSAAQPPDARIVLIQALATLHDDNGDVAVAGLLREPWTGTSYSDDEFRGLAEVREGIPLQGTGDLGSRIWSGPAITVTAFDAPGTDAPLNAVASRASASLNLRVHPKQNPEEALDALVEHLEQVTPFGISLTLTRGEVGPGFAGKTSGPAFDAAAQALSFAWGQDAATMAGGGSIPLVMALQEAAPHCRDSTFWRNG